MSFPICWRCLSNASARSLRQTARGSRPPTGVLALAFSTTPYVQFPLSPKKSSGVKVIHKKGSKSLVIKKGKRSDDNRVRRPAPGERKALRKRIVLSNVNAFEVEGMQDVNAENMYDGRLRGHVLGLPGPIVDQLRAAGAFKPSQAWGMFRRPGMLIRRETLEIGKIVADMHAENESKSTLRTILVGERGSGKSMLLLQAMTMAILNSWTVINLPEAQDITIGHTPYTPLASSSPINYVQPGYYAHLLQQISVANPHLADLPLSQEPSKMTIPVPIPPNISLAHFASLGASDREIAHPIFNLLVTELLSPGRPPVFFGLDGLAHAMQPATGYTAPHMTPIHPHNLEILKWYFEFLSGKKTLPNGGIIMAATSQSNAPKVPALDVALSQLEGPIESPAGQAVPSKERIPFVKYDEGVFKTLIGGEKAIEIRRLEGLSKEETRGLLEYWARSGMLRERVTEGFLGEKWALSGGGVVGELERAVVRMRV
ncbi:MAG: hypothetical protein Q9201_001178 [Fulgogasparrea decipioides]